MCLGLARWPLPSTTGGGAPEQSSEQEAADGDGRPPGEERSMGPRRVTTAAPATWVVGRACGKVDVVCRRMHAAPTYHRRSVATVQSVLHGLPSFASHRQADKTNQGRRAATKEGGGDSRVDDTRRPGTAARTTYVQPTLHGCTGRAWVGG
jgi:hypothetical protein